MITKTIDGIIRSFRKNELSQMEFILEISHAVGMSGKTRFTTARDYALHLLN